MAWQKHGPRTYFYRSVRCDGRVRSVYYGAGPVGRFAAAADALRRAEREAAAAARRAQNDQVGAAVALTRALCDLCDLLASATLLAAGYHRPSRPAWRSWGNGRRTLRESG